MNLISKFDTNRQGSAENQSHLSPLGDNAFALFSLMVLNKLQRILSAHT